MDSSKASVPLTGGDAAIDDAGPSDHRMQYVPALDGLRGLAVVAVLVYHHGVGWARGGFLGVSLFFTLSGFLITSLLVGEHRATGRLDLPAFWSRRVRRLAPAALLGIALALAATMVVVPEAQRASALVDIRAALAQLSNWRFVAAETPYANVGTTPSPVLHYWSLAIEEQYYLVFPLVVALALRRGTRTLVAVLGTLTAASVALQVVLPASDRVYFGTDTRAAELLVGSLLALGWWHLSPQVRGARRWDVVGAAGLLVTLALWSIVPQSDPRLLSGGLALVAVVSGAVLVGAMGGGAVSRGLAASPLVGVGRISYGVYVFHLPVFLVLTPARVGVEGPALLGLRVAVTLAVATASYRLVERPVRLGTPLLGRRLQGPAAGVTVVAGLVLLAAVSIPLQRVVPVGGPTPTGFAPLAVQAAVASHPGAVPASSSPSRPPRVVVVGDSTAEAIGTGLRDWGARTGRLQVSAVFSPGCAVLEGVTARYREGFEFSPDGCDRLFPVALQEVRDVEADALLVFIGSPQLADWRYADRSGWHDITDPALARAYRHELDLVLDLMTASGVPVLWADVPVPDWDVEQFGALLGGELPGFGEPVINEPARAEVLDHHTRAGLDATPGAVVIEFAAGLGGADGRIGPGDRIDGLHLSNDQVAEAAETWLVDAIADAYRRAWAELGMAPPVEVGWQVLTPAAPR